MIGLAFADHLREEKCGKQSTENLKTIGSKKLGLKYMFGRFWVLVAFLRDFTLEFWMSNSPTVELRKPEKRAYSPALHVDVHSGVAHT